MFGNILIPAEGERQGTKSNTTFSKQKKKEREKKRRAKVGIRKEEEEGGEEIFKKGTKIEQILYVVNTLKNKVFGRSLLLFGETVVTHLYLPGVMAGPVSILNTKG